jgi:TolB-like protein/Flp pilus assembly protein TadD
MNRPAHYVYDFGPFRLNPPERLLLLGTTPVPLTPKVFETLVVLVRNSGHVVNKDDLMKEIWPDTNVEEANLTQNIFMLRKALDQHQEGRSYIETVPKRGYRFSTNVRKVADGGRLLVEPDESLPVIDAKAGESKPVIHSLAVLPLANASVDPNAEYLSDGITESIINNLSQLSGLRVMARSTVFRYKGREVDAQEVGREMGVRAVLTGRVLYLGNRLIIRIELIDVSDGRQIWGEQYDCEPLDIIAVQAEMSREISENLRLRLSGQQKRLLTKRYTENTVAYHAYLKGRYYWNKRTEEGFKKGIEYFQQAIHEDSDYALAYAGLADCYNLLNSYGVLQPSESAPIIKAVAKQALTIDNMLAEAHASLGHVKMMHDWDWPGAESEFRRAIQLNPNYATAHHWHALYLRAMGRFDESLEEIRQAQRLDPLSLIINTVVGTHFYYARQYDRAIEQCRETLELNPDFHVAYGVIGEAYTQKGMYKEAMAALQKAISLSSDPEGLVMLGYTHAVAGHRSEARKALNRLKNLSKRRYIEPASIAIIYTGLMEREQAFAWLERAYEHRNELLAMLRVDPRLDALRPEPRFTQLLRRVGLQEQPEDRLTLE